MARGFFLIGKRIAEMRGRVNGATGCGFGELGAGEQGENPREVGLMPVLGRCVMPTEYRGGFVGLKTAAKGVSGAESGSQRGRREGRGPKSEVRGRKPIHLDPCSSVVGFGLRRSEEG